ncbi:DUF3772 domain-containing protein [Hansschlegelia sp.]|uniref:DUF3772 domain-containing protein n=1 Tax=Hansschlegelia sp. TaxID=2041892 RepID=UPI002BA9A159|nr:DUF3772 domain-containing protein [Hansschlegelia sp.]HVI27117.1 DUF3772 domain-containing protein [Hansschlegelia sp.]
MTSKLLRIRALCIAVALVASIAAAGFARAQNSEPGAIDAARADLDRIEARLADPNIKDADLATLRSRIDPLVLSVDSAITELSPQLDAADQRLAQMGPKPAEGAPAESPDVAREREAQTAARQKIDDAIKRGRLLQVEAAQVGDQITQRRRTLLAQRLFERSNSLLDPGLWTAVVASAPHDLGRMQYLASDWASAISRNADPGSVGIMAAAVLAAVILLFPGRRWIGALGERLVVRQAPKTRLKISATALFRLVATTLAPLLAAVCVYIGLKSAGWMTIKIEPLIHSLIWAAGLLGFAQGMIRAVLAPGRPSWRLARLSEPAVSEIKNQPLWCMLAFVLGRFADHFNETIVASLPFTIASSGFFAVLVAGVFAVALRRMRAARLIEDRASDAPEAVSHPLLSVTRLAAWLAIGVVLGAVALGYVALGQFLANQLVWAAAVISLCWLLLIFVDDLLTTALSSRTGFGRSTAAAVGVRPESLEQVGVVLSGVARVALICVAAVSVLAPWGVESTDVFGWLRYAITGVQLGGITLSLTGVLGALLLVGLGYALTRAVQRWLNSDLLPKSRMDEGLKASISTGVGYLGGLIVIVAAFGYLGFSLDKLAIVAGALSVGIGFGLQAIISNFVSGLILLAERPIKAGDWVVIGSDQGNVRRISVRSTEIELFDRSTLIVPNSEFITKSVKNVTHGSPLGRVQIDLVVSSAIDPDLVRRVAIETAKAHPAVIEFPEPLFQFITLGKAENTFSLFCNVASPRTAGSVKSDLNFALVKALSAQGIALGGPPDRTMVEAVTRVAEALRGAAATPTEIRRDPGAAATRS